MLWRFTCHLDASWRRGMWHQLARASRRLGRLQPVRIGRPAGALNGQENPRSDLDPFAQHRPGAGAAGGGPRQWLFCWPRDSSTRERAPGLKGWRPRASRLTGKRGDGACNGTLKPLDPITPF